MGAPDPVPEAVTIRQVVPLFTKPCFEDVTVNGTKVPAMLDNGATACFARRSFVERIPGCVVESVPDVVASARVANGHTLDVIGVAQVVVDSPHIPVLKAAKASCVARLIVVRELSCDLILGIPWFTVVSPLWAEWARIAAVSCGEEHYLAHRPKDSGCGACALGKMRRRPARRTGEQAGVRDALDVDLIDAGRDDGGVGRGGERYALVGADRRDGWLFVEPVEDKTAASCAKAMDVALAGTHWPRVVKSDGGKEFRGVFEDLVRLKGSLSEFGLPNRPNSHALIESRNRDVVEPTRAALVEAGLPARFWPDAIKHQTFVYNRHSSSHPGRETPYEKRYGTAYAQDKLAPFGCAVLFLSDETGKFEARAKLGVLLRFHGEVGFVVAPVDDLANGVVREIATRDVEFRRTEFPARRLGLRPLGERLWLDDDVDRVPEDAEECIRCRKTRIAVVLCYKCLGKRAKRHRRDGTCTIGACKCTVEDLLEYSRREARHKNARDERESARAEKDRVREERASEAMRKRAQNAADQAAREMALRAKSARALAKKRRREETVVARDAQGAKPDATFSGVRTRAGRATKAPRRFELNVTEVVPRSVAVKNEAFTRARNDELEKLARFNAWDSSPVQWTAARTVPRAIFVRGHFIYTLKHKERGAEAQRYKVRFVAAGNNLKSHDGERAEQPVPYAAPSSLAALRLVLAWAAACNHAVMGMDMTSAYLQSDLRGDPVFICLPEEAPGARKGVYRLRKALYGLPRAGADFVHETADKLRKAGWTERVASVFWRDGVYIVAYVDDFLIVGPQAKILQVKEELRKMFVFDSPCLLSDAQQIRFLGITVRRVGDQIELDHTDYARHLIKSYAWRLQNIVGAPRTPDVAVEAEDFENGAPDAPRSELGALLWLARTTRPDLARAVARVARLVDRWSLGGERLLKRIF
ncbi:Copia protein [Porphyridium purpureum]|uniref:Copia protein n=1 Tax=Porphyridium purpureum TaxID=35688 RepID=A0A5J4YK31_PORPP|nr:Copia protein [Porphyridium purpureum]|eukprot:POR0727..scf210_14